MNHEDLLRVLHYDPTTGLFTWRVDRGRLAKKGGVAGHLHHSGYIAIQVLGSNTMAHRLAWFYVNGVWPSGEIDHKNGARGDNRIDNLRDVDRSANMENQEHAHCRNKTGLLGVSWHKRSGKFQSRIRVAKKLVALGYFDTAEAAHAKYLLAKNQLHKNSIRLLDISVST